MRFWNISLVLLSFCIPGMADLSLENCKRQEEFVDYPRYNCSSPKNSTIKVPVMRNKWTLVSLRVNSSSEAVPLLLVNGEAQLLSRKFKDCVSFDGNLSISNLAKCKGEYDVKEKEIIKACIYVDILPDQQIERNWAVCAVLMQPTSYFVLCCMLLLGWTVLPII